MGLDFSALTSALGYGAMAGAQGYNVDEERRRKQAAEGLAARRLADQEARQAVLDQANVDHLHAETNKLNEPEKDAYYGVQDNPGYVYSRRTGKASKLTAPDTGEPFKPRPRPWAPSSEREALDFDSKKQHNRAVNRPPGAGGQVTPRMRQSFLQDRLRYHMTPKEDTFGDPVSGTGLDREEALSEAQRDVEAAYGHDEQPTPERISAPPGQGSILRGGGAAAGPAAPAPAAPAARAPAPSRGGQQSTGLPAPTVTHSAVGQDPNASLSPSTGRPVRPLSDREKAAARANYVAPGKRESFQQTLLKMGYKPKDWQ